MPGFVPESVLKKRRTAEQLQAKRNAEAAGAKKKQAEKKKDMIKRAETYVKEYKQLENDAIRLRREAKKAGAYYVPPEPKLAFVVRIRGACAGSLFSRGRRAAKWFAGHGHECSALAGVRMLAERGRKTKTVACEVGARSFREAISRCFQTGSRGWARALWVMESTMIDDVVMTMMGEVDGDE